MSFGYGYGGPGYYGSYYGNPYGLGYGSYDYGGYYGGLGYGTAYSNYPSYRRYYAGSPANVYAVPVAPDPGYAQPGYATRPNAAPTQITPQTVLRPGMVLPDGAVVVSVGGPAPPNTGAPAEPAPAGDATSVGKVVVPDAETGAAPAAPAEEELPLTTDEESPAATEPPPIPTPEVN